MKKIIKPLAAAILGSLVVSICAAGDGTGRKKERRKGPLIVTAVPWGPTEGDIKSARERAEQTAANQPGLKDSQYSYISIENVDAETGDVRTPPSRFRAFFYDYTHNQTYAAEGDFAGREPIAFRAEKDPPRITDEELKAAYGIIANDGDLGPLYAKGLIELSPAMPPVTDVDGDRLVNVGIRDTITGSFKVVGVQFRKGIVHRYLNDAPPTSNAATATCGITAQSGTCPGCGAISSAQITVQEFPGQNPPLWDMLVVRPLTSSGNPSEGSGVEVRDVKYKGKSVLKRGHAPVLDVQYVGNACGPFRDWQNQESYFNAPDAGANDLGGIKILGAGQVATTAIDTDIDAGNFFGVAVYTQDIGNGNETVLVSEMLAGWYRYIMEWRFAPDGTIRPRYGFGAVANACVCSAHTHHIYWRFDFDVVNPNNKVFQVERGRKFMAPILTETKISRNYATNKSIVVRNASGNEAVKLTPGLKDGVADAFGSGDFWILKFQGTPTSPSELNDPNSSSAINIDPWVDGESLLNQDAVVWYAAHFIHDDGQNLAGFRPQVLGTRHVVGPTIRLIQW